MASIAKDANGRKRILFFNQDGERKTLRIGVASMHDARTVATRVDLLVAAKRCGTTPEPETAKWAATRGDELYGKLAKYGLVPPRAKVEQTTLGPFLDGYIAGRSDIRPNTLRNVKNSRGRLVNYFGETKPLAEITPGGADDWRQSMVNSGLAMATISKAVKHAKQFFRYALRKGLIALNPFQDLRAGGERNDSRLQFVDRPTIDRVIAAAPDAQWRLIIALSRYGGLRCPSEHLALRWGDVDWERGRITIPSSKTEGQGKGFRVIPLFPELRPYLEQVFDQAESGTEYVITRYRDTNSNLRTRFLKIIRRAGVEPWERLFHNLRASRQTELTDQFPAHVVARWLGNSPAIAERHYLQTIEAHYERACEPLKAAQNPAQQPTVSGEISGKEREQIIAPLLENAELTTCTHVQVPPRGFEPLSPP